MFVRRVPMGVESYHSLDLFPDREARAPPRRRRCLHRSGHGGHAGRLILAQCRRCCHHSGTMGVEQPVPDPEAISRGRREGEGGLGNMRRCQTDYMSYEIGI